METPAWKRENHPVGGFVPQVLQVRWQDQLGLDQRKQKHHRDNRWNLSRVVSPIPVEEHHWDKRHDGRQRAERDRRRNLFRALDGSIQRIISLADPAVDIFGGHDGIVDDNPGHDDESEQAHHVGCQTKPRHEDRSASKADWDSDHDPKGDGRSNEQPQDHQHKETAQGQCPSQCAQSLTNRNRLIVPNLQTDSLGKDRRCFGNVLAYLSRDLKRVLIAYSHDFQQERRTPVVVESRLVLTKSVGDLRDVTDSNLGATDRPERNLFKLATRKRLTIGAHDERPTIAVDRSGREIDRKASNRVGKLLKAKAVSQEFFNVRLDADLSLDISLQDDPADPGHLQEVTLDLVCDVAKLTQRQDRR